MRDTMLFMLLMEGSDPEDFTADEFTAAIDALQGSSTAARSGASPATTTSTT